MIVLESGRGQQQLDRMPPIPAVTQTVHLLYPTFNHGVPGSIPGGPTNQISGFREGRSEDGCSDNAPGLWSLPVVGDSETFVLPDVQQNLWAVADGGIAFVVQSSKVSPKRPVMRFFSFISGRVSTLADLPIGEALYGYSIRRDDRSALWPRPDTSLNDLMLIDPWRQ